MDDFKDEGYERDFAREDVRIAAKLGADGQWCDCMVVNLSSSGARLKVDRALRRGQDVVIQFGETGQFNATVAWCEGGAIGVRFNHDPDEITRMMIAIGA